MKFTPKAGIIVLAILLLVLSMLTACGGDDDDGTPVASPAVTEEPTAKPTQTIEPTVEPAPEPTREPTPAPDGPTWVYNVNYLEENTVWTVSVTGEETVEGVDCYVTRASFDDVVNREFYSSPDVLLEFRYVMDWISKSTGDLKQYEMDINALGMVDVITTVTGTYANENHGAPLNIGDTWSVDYMIVLEPQVSPDVKMSYQVEVAGMEEVTVPAGTFECYKVEQTLVASDDIPEDTPTVKTEWWATGEEFLVPVKIVDGALFGDPETRELVSYTTV